MVLDGVSVDDWVVRELAAHVDGPLRRKLEQALFFSARVVALTSRERVAVLAAFEQLPWRFEEVRETLLAGDQWAEALPSTRLM